MKKIFLFGAVLIAFASFAQGDSSRATITVSVQARDLSWIANFTWQEPIFEDLDSIMKTKWRVPNRPSGTTNVSIPGVQVRAWWWILLKLSYDPVAIHTNIVSRLSAVLNAAGNSWLSYRISRETANILARQNAGILSGDARLLKEVDTIVIQ